MSVPLEHLLEQIVTLLDAASESAWRSTLEGLLAEVEATHGVDMRHQQVLRRILQLYTAGMGSFNDLVLQADGRVLPEQSEFAIARTRLFDTAREQLG